MLAEYLALMAKMYADKDKRKWQKKALVSFYMLIYFSLALRFSLSCGAHDDFQNSNREVKILSFCFHNFGYKLFSYSIEFVHRAMLYSSVLG